MTNLGLSDWVADSEDEYIAKAAIFAADMAGLAELRAGMRQRMVSSPVMDGAGFARGVESAYREMFNNWARQ
jgi:predicted O-linked N-acetylglucosamine transferase (SPINDLY family)